MTQSKQPIQLSLEVSLSDDATFATYYPTDSNSVGLNALMAFSKNRGEQNLVIWGGHHCGLTHLLQACNHMASQNAISVQYVPLHDVINFSPDEVFNGLGSKDLICLDGIDVICGNSRWEQSLFHFYNQQRDRGGRLLMSSHVSPQLLDLKLPDLKSRVNGSVVYHIQTLNDDDKANALQMRAKVRGMEMSDEVSKYIMSRAPRDTVELFKLLNRLDRVSLQQQRKLTIPFVKGQLTR